MRRDRTVLFCDAKLEMRTRTEPYGMHLGYADGDLFGLGEDGGADKKLDRLREKAQLMPVLKRAHPA